MKSFERNHLLMIIFHKNKDARSKGQNKNEFYSILPARKTNVNIIFLIAKWNMISGKGNIFSSVNCFTTLSAHAAYLSSQITVLWRLKLQRIFLTVSSTVTFAKVHSYEKPRLAFLIWSVFGFSQCQISRSCCFKLED